MAIKPLPRPPLCALFLHVDLNLDAEELLHSVMRRSADTLQFLSPSVRPFRKTTDWLLTKWSDTREVRKRSLLVAVFHLCLCLINRSAILLVPPFRSHGCRLSRQEFHLVFQRWNTLKDLILFMVQDAAAYFSHRKCGLSLSSPLPSICSFSYWLSYWLSAPFSHPLLTQWPAAVSFFAHLSSLVLKCSPSPLTHFIDFAPDADPYCHRFTVTESVNKPQANGRGLSFWSTLHNHTMKRWNNKMCVYVCMWVCVFTPI